MQIYYCDTCGKRVGQDELASGEATQSAEGTHCGNCVKAVNAPAVQSPPARSVTPKSGMTRGYVSSRRSPADAQPRTHSGRQASATARRPEKNTTAILIAGAGVLMLAAGAALLLKSPKTQETGREKAPAAAVEKPAPAPVVLTPPPQQPPALQNTRGDSATALAPAMPPPPEKPRAAPTGPVMGRYVRIELPGPQRILSLAEVEVISNKTNIARKGKVRQSSTEHGGDASRANDGNTNGDFNGKRTTTHSAQELGPWWEVDLNSVQQVDEIVIWNRTDCCGERLDRFSVSVLSPDRKILWRKTEVPAPSPKAAFNLNKKN